MSNHRNDLLDLHHAAVVGSLMGARPRHAAAAAHDAEPEPCDARQGILRRLVAAVRSRRRAAARPKTGRA